MIKVAVYRGRQEDRRLKAVRYFAGFLVFMLVCTIISRGIYAIRMPQVVVGKAERKTISHKIEADGVVENEAEKAVIVPEGIRVLEVLVQTGEKVCTGDAILCLDLENLEEKRKLLSQELAVAEQRLLEVKENQERQNSAAAKAQKRAQEDLDHTIAEQENQIAAAQSDYEKAVEALNKYPSFEVYLEEEKRKDPEYQSFQSAEGKQDASEEEKDALHFYEDAFMIAKEEEWRAGKEALEAVKKEKEAALNSAEKDKENAVREAGRVLEDAELNTAQTVPEITSEMTELSNMISNQKEKLNLYENLIRAGGEVKSPFEGIVQKICLSAGDHTTDGAAILISDDSRGMQFTASITEEERGYVSEEMSAELTFLNGKNRLTELQIESIAKQEDGSYHLRIDVSGHGLSQGETGSLTINPDGTVYECCVPLSALKTNGAETYVLVLQENETFLGTEYSVRWQKVVVETQNEAYAALKDCPLGAEDKIILSADREIENGDVVRMKEN